MQKQKTLMVSVVGVPNAGKSTLINNIINEKISAVSPKPHTTRTTVYGIYTKDDTQIIFMDTPGFMRSNMSVNNQGDIMCFIIDGLNPWAYNVKEKIKNLIGKVELLIFINKIDAMRSADYMEIMEELRKLGYHGSIGGLSGMYKRGVEELKQQLMDRALEYPWLFEANQKHTLTMQDIIKECIREKIFHIAYHELPYNSEVEVKDLTFFIPERVNTRANNRTEVYQSRDGNTKQAGLCDTNTRSDSCAVDVVQADIRKNHTKQAGLCDTNTRSDSCAVDVVQADIRKNHTKQAGLCEDNKQIDHHTAHYEQRDPRKEWIANVVIYVDKASQQAILVGTGGKMIKRISQSARMELIDRFGYGQLFVKVNVKQ